MTSSMPPDQSPKPQSPNPSQENADHGDNPLVNIVMSIVIPSLILSKLSDPSKLGPVWSLVVALAFPFGAFVYEFIKKSKASFISILGIVSISLTGGFGLFKVDGIWFAVKDAAIPGFIAMALVVSLKTKSPLVRTLLYNDKIIDVDLVHRELERRGNLAAFERILVTATFMLSGSFVLSSVLNFILAIMILKSPTGTPEFNQELGKMTALSYPVIALPCMITTMGALWWLLSGIKKLTGLTLEELFKGQPQKVKDS